MTGDDLRNARKALGELSAAEMARQLKTPLRTYQDWESGENRIPGIAEVAVDLLMQKDNWVMNGVFSRIDERIRADFPVKVEMETCG